MGFKCGIVGLPNVGKSTLFNALTNTASAAAENYPFCTIEPNVGQVPVPDTRQFELAKIAKSKDVIPTQLSFVDIAGLVRGASKGEGLGNQFLANIREVDAICHVLRCFDDDDITHVDGRVNPVEDAETIETELMLADLESLEGRIHGLQRKVKGGDKEAILTLTMIERCIKVLQEGKAARVIERTSPDEERAFDMLQLLTSKPILYICNVDEDSAADGNDYSKAVEKMALDFGAGCVVISAAVEAEIAQLDDASDQREFLESLGLGQTGLARVIRAGYDLLGLITYFTCGPKETRAWTITEGTKGPQAAGVIHTDFEKGYIRAETITYTDYVALGGENGAKDAGKMRAEGKEYIVKDGDVLHFLTSS